MTLLLTYKIGSTLWDEDTGLFAGALLLGIPYLFTQVPLMLVDVPAMFLLSLSLFTFLRALERGGIWPAISAFVLFLSFYAKYSLWLMLSVLGIVFLVYCIQGEVKRDKVIKRGAIVAAAAGILIGGVFWYNYDLFSGQMAFLQEYQKPGLKRWSESFISTFFFQVHPFISISALFSVYVALKKRDIKYLIISWLLILFLVLQIKRARYMIPAFPMLALMASYGLQWIKEREVRRFIDLCIVQTSTIVSLFFYLPFLQGMSAVNLKETGRFLDSSGINEVEVITIPSDKSVINTAVSIPLLDLFTESRLAYRYSPGEIPSDNTEESSLRFTWGYSNPGYYSYGDEDAKRALVVISSEAGQDLPEGLKARTEGRSLVKTFDISTGIFRYVTVVNVYE
jgi:hypothetical protein